MNRARCTHVSLDFVTLARWFWHKNVDENGMSAARHSSVSERPSRAFSALLWLLCAAIAAWPVLQFGRVAARRIGYPFELEWMEGAIVDHIRVVLSGQALYREPTFEFTPFIYVPGYYYVSAAVSKLVGIGLVAPRLVSLVSISGCFALLAVWVHKETRNLIAAIVTVGLFAATYGESSYWFDIARVDSLLLFLLLSGEMLVRFGSRARQALLAGALLAFAALTKQVGLVLAAPALGFALIRCRPRGLWTLGGFISVTAISFGLLELSSHGWFSFYAFRVPADHQIERARLIAELQQHFFGPVAPMALCSLAVVLRCIVRVPISVWGLHAARVIVATATALVAILHTGGYPNVLIPAHAAMALCSGLVFAHLWRIGPINRGAAVGSLGYRLLSASVVWLQIAVLPAIHLDEIAPSKEDRDAGEHLLATIKKSKGPVWMVSSGYYPMLAHDAPILGHAMAFSDVFKSKREGVKRRLADDLLGAIRSKRFATIVLDRAEGFLPSQITSEIRKNYHLKRRIFSPDDPRFWPKLGAAIRPDELWEPNATQEDGSK